MKIYFIFATAKARIAQLVEHDLAKVGVAGPSPVSRSFLCSLIRDARVVELVDTLDLKSNGHRVRAGSSPASGTKAEFLCKISFPLYFFITVPNKNLQTFFL